MSRAFVREDSDAGDPLPDRPVSPHRNLVTAAGLRRIERELDEARRRIAVATAEGDRAGIAAAGRDGRYWAARRSSAEIVDQGEGDTVRFGSTVTIERADGRRRRFRIVGEDEADPARDLLSYVAPLARAVLGRRVNDEAEFAGETVLVVDLSRVD